MVAALAARSPCAVISPRRKRRHPRACNAARYAQRHAIEHLLSRLKPLQRVATRDDKFAARFWAFIQLAATVLGMKTSNFMGNQADSFERIRFLLSGASAYLESIGMSTLSVMAS